MAATTISRTTLTDGTAGTTLNNALWGSSIYDPIDNILSSNVVFGGTLSVEGQGDHVFSGSGSGANTIVVKNTTAGTSNLASLELGTDTDADVGRLEAYTSTYSDSGTQVNDGVALRALQDGGLSIAAEHASGLLRFYGGGTTLGASVDVNGIVFDQAPDCAEASPASPDLSRLYPEALVKAWAHVTNSGTPTLDNHYNVTSLTDSATGITVVNFATNLAVSTYAAVASVESGAAATVHCHTYAVGSVTVLTENSAGTDTDLNFALIVVGE